jgi:hypothetical protein
LRPEPLSLPFPLAFLGGNLCKSVAAIGPGVADLYDSREAAQGALIDLVVAQQFRVIEAASASPRTRAPLALLLGSASTSVIWWSLP